MIVEYFVCVLKALAGRRQWLRLKKKFGIDKGLYALLMTDKDRELNLLALENIDKFIKYKRATGVVVLTQDDFVLAQAEAVSGVIAVVKLTEKQVENYYCFYNYHYYLFTERLLSVTLKRTYVGDVTNVLGVNGLTKEDLLCLGVYVMRDWQGKG